MQWNGEGTLTARNESYVGTFKANKRDGTGSCTYADGSTYTGTWTTLAVDPSYVQLPVSSSGGINPGGPILY